MNELCYRCSGFGGAKYVYEIKRIKKGEVSGNQFAGIHVTKKKVTIIIFSITILALNLGL